MSTVADLAAAFEVRWCSGGCGLSDRRHRQGFVFLGVVHFADRRFSRRSARNFLLLVARQRREADPQYLNIPLFDWYYLYHDAVHATEMAGAAGFRIPARLWNDQREQVRLLAARRGVHLSRPPYRAIYEWSRTR